MPWVALLETQWVIKFFHWVKVSSFSGKTRVIEEGSLPDSGMVMVDSSMGEMTSVESGSWNSRVTGLLGLIDFLDKISLIEFP